MLNREDASKTTSEQQQLKELVTLWVWPAWNYSDMEKLVWKGAMYFGSRL